MLSVTLVPFVAFKLWVSEIFLLKIDSRYLNDVTDEFIDEFYKKFCH